MKTSTKIVFKLFFLTLILLLSGCTNAGASPTLSIHNPKGYEGVLVSGASSLIQTSGYEEKFISGKDKANELIDMLNGKELVEASEEVLQERTNDIDERGNYRVLLYNKPSFDSDSGDIYLLLFYEDGTIQVTQEAISYFIVDPPKDLLTHLKSDWDISF